MYRIVFWLCGSLLVFACGEKTADTIALPYYNEPDFTPVFIKNKTEVNRKIPHTIDDFAFLDQDSTLVTQKMVENKIHVANFIFTVCPSICPIMTRNLTTVSDELQHDKNVVFLSYSVTPWHDTPSLLKRYKDNNGIKNDNWHFLTGKKGDIYNLARKSYFAEEDIGFSRDSSEFLHTEHFLLVDKSKRIRGIYNGTLQLEMQQLLADIRTLQKED